MYWLAALLAVLLVVVLVTRWIGAITILEYERALKFIRGRFVEVIGPGKYWHWTRTTSFHRIDVRPTYVTVTGQEVLSADGLAIKASLLAVYRIADAKTAILGVEDVTTAVHAQLQLALRTVVSGTSAEELLQKRADISNELTSLAAPALAPVGVELQSAALRDLTLPGELKKVFSQVVRARQDGLAALERARGETAALRNLANAAQLVQQNPHLLQLRILQVLEQQPGHTVVLGPAGGLVPVPTSRPVNQPPSAGASE
jgi:regulator of protease activity HflC (stomatin/prohibitin superfamily)